jgi:hypothetical protein
MAGNSSAEIASLLRDIRGLLQEQNLRLTSLENARPHSREAPVRYIEGEETSDPQSSEKNSVPRTTQDLRPNTPAEPELVPTATAVPEEKATSSPREDSISV